jgi:hypothetical protein
MKHHFGGILSGIYKPSEKFFIKSPYPYLPKCTDPPKVNLLVDIIYDRLE